MRGAREGVCYSLWLLLLVLLLLRLLLLLVRHCRCRVDGVKEGSFGASRGLCRFVQSHVMAIFPFSRGMWDVT